MTETVRPFNFHLRIDGSAEAYVLGQLEVLFENFLAQ